MSSSTSFRVKTSLMISRSLGLEKGKTVISGNLGAGGV
jgi:hypothetical protein